MAFSGQGGSRGPGCQVKGKSSSAPRTFCGWSWFVAPLPTGGLGPRPVVVRLGWFEFVRLVEPRPRRQNSVHWILARALLLASRIGRDDEVRDIDSHVGPQSKSLRCGSSPQIGTYVNVGVFTTYPGVAVWSPVENRRSVVVLPGARLVGLRATGTA